MTAPRSWVRRCDTCRSSDVLHRHHCWDIGVSEQVAGGGKHQLARQRRAPAPQPSLYGLTVRNGTYLEVDSQSVMLCGGFVPQSTTPRWLSDAVGGLVAGDLDAGMNVYADTVVHELPFADEGVPQRLEGKDQIARFMAQLPHRIRFGSFTDVRVREVDDEVIVEAEGHHRQVSDDTPFDLRYVWIITRRDGHVMHIRDYMSPRRPSERS